MSIMACHQIDDGFAAIAPIVAPGPGGRSLCLRLRDFLLRIDERLCHDRGFSRSRRGHNLYLRPDPRVLGRNPRVADVLLQAGRHRERSERANLLSVLPNRPWFWQPGTDHLIPRDLDADE